MRKLIVLHVAIVLSLSSMLFRPPKAFAEDKECRGMLSKMTVVGNVIVPDDATCTLNGTIVKGNITVKSRAALITNGVKISAASRAKAQTRSLSTLARPSATMFHSVREWTLPLTKPGSRVTYSSKKTLGSVSVKGNSIIGSVQANKNRDGGITISSNTIGNGLQCQENNPPPTGSGNIAKQKQGQCVNL